MGVPPGMPDEVPSYFSTYFAVADADQAAQNAAAAGGTVMSAPFDSPYGKMAVMSDPQGAPFSIIALADD
jgi:predicted enzyme related to lactoylglutathione lyase